MTESVGNKIEVANAVEKLVCDPENKNMRIFRDRDKAFYNKSKAFREKSEEDTQAYNKRKSECSAYLEYVKAQEEEDNLRDSYNALHAWLVSHSKKKVGSANWKKRQKQSERFKKRFERAQSQREVKKAESEKALQTIWDEIVSSPTADPIAALSMSQTDTPALAHIKSAFGWYDSDDEVYDKKLKILVDYARLTVLHDKILKGEAEPINNDIWPENEEWIENLWRKMPDTQDADSKIDLSLHRVEMDLTATRGFNTETPESGATGGKAGSEQSAKAKESQSDSAETIIVSNEEGDKVKTIKKPSQAEKYAWESYNWIMEDKPDLLPSEAERWYSKEMYSHLKENGPFYNNDPKKPRKMPHFYAWARYLRRYEQWRSSCGNNQVTISDQPESSVRRQDVQDEDLRKLSSRFNIDNPG